MTRSTQNLTSLFGMIETRRPAGSKSERAWIRQHLIPLGVDQDALGNVYKRIGGAPILWSSHTDTVHRAGGRQRVCLTGDTLSVTGSNCLGADNTAGVWLMCEMIRASVPGLYVFHRSEEEGGIGSGFIAKETPELVEGIRAAIAFDRRGTQSIITHQWAGRSCSDAFGHSLAATLDMDMHLDTGGTFTDTASYVDLIGECTNVSAGFTHEHSTAETLSVSHLVKLREALLSADFSQLVFSREPGAPDPDEITWTDHYDNTARGWDQFDNDNPWPTSLARIVRDDPDAVADWLENFGVSANELADAIYQRRWQ